MRRFWSRIEKVDSQSERKGPVISLKTAIRAVAVVIASAAIAWVVTSVDFPSRSVSFSTFAVAPATAGERPEGNLARLGLLTRCVGYIRSNYVVPDRVQPLPMLMGALRATEGMVADLMVTSDAEEPEDVKSVVVRVGDSQKTFSLTGISDLYEMNWRLLDIFEFISANLPSDVEPAEVEYAAINGLLAPLDEHSVFLPPRAFNEMKLDTQGRFGGLGIVITVREGVITVVSVMSDTPAASAGLKSTDQILEIDDESTINMNLSDAVFKLRGDPDTDVRILVKRKEWSEPRPFKITRAIIHVNSVTSEDLGNGIGYVLLRHFQEDTRETLEAELDKLRKKGALKGLVLDLRQDPGGLLEQAVEVGDLFIAEGSLVVTEGEGKRMRQEYRADRGDSYENLPLVVLVDSGSASAAEIVAGALKNDNRAPLIGTRTFGKGTVQVMYEVGDGALKLTVAQYLTPGDVSIQGVGVVPDIEMVPATFGKKTIRLDFPDYRRFKDKDRTLQAFGKTLDEIPSVRVPFVVEDEDLDRDMDSDDEPPLKEDKFVRDPAMDIAAAMLNDRLAVTREGLLKTLPDAVAKWSAQQDLKIVEKLAVRGVDWTSGPVHPGAKVSLKWSASGGRSLLAGSDATLRLSVHNDGSDTLYRVRVTTETDNPVLDARDFIFGRIEPGQTVTREVDLQIPRDTWDRRDIVEFRVFQGDHEQKRPEPVTVVSRGLVRPRFAYSVQVQDGAGNGDGITNPGESVGIIVDIANVGEGLAAKVLTTLRNKSGESVYVKRGRVNLNDGIPVGRTAQARFQLDLQPEYDKDEVVIELGILDLKLREYVYEEIVLPVSRSPSMPQLITSGLALKTLKDGVEVLSAASNGAFGLFTVPAGSFLRAVARIGAFYRVAVDNDRFAFVRADEVQESSGVVRYVVLPESPRSSFIQPSLALKFEDTFLDGKPAVRVLGQIRFDGTPGEARRKVLIYRDNDKVHFWTKKGPTRDEMVAIDKVIPLSKGRNDIAIYAIEGKDRSAVRRTTIVVPKSEQAFDAVGGVQ